MNRKKRGGPPEALNFQLEYHLPKMGPAKLRRGSWRRWRNWRCMETG